MQVLYLQNWSINILRSTISKHISGNGEELDGYMGKWRRPHKKENKNRTNHNFVCLKMYKTFWHILFKCKKKLCIWDIEFIKQNYTNTFQKFKLKSVLLILKSYLLLFAHNDTQFDSFFLVYQQYSVQNLMCCLYFSGSELILWFMKQSGKTQNKYKKVK